MRFQYTIGKNIHLKESEPSVLKEVEEVYASYYRDDPVSGAF